MNHLIKYVLLYSLIFSTNMTEAREKTKKRVIPHQSQKNSVSKTSPADCDQKKNPFIEKKEEVTRTITSDSSSLKKPSSSLNPLTQDEGCQLPKKSF